MALTGKQIRHLRALGHHIDPVVQIGKNGITEALTAQLAEAIAHHELIKVKVLPECPIDRKEAGEAVASAIGAELAQTLGRTLLLWKRNPQAAKIELPNARGELKSAAHKDTSKGKLPPSRSREPAEAASDEPKPWRHAPGEGPGARREGRAPARRAAPRPTGEARPRREEGPVTGASRARTARSPGGGSRPSAGGRPAPRRPAR